MVTAAPDDLDRQYELADILFQIGESLNRRRKYEEAMLLYREAEAIWRTVVDKQHYNKQWRLQLLKAYYTIGQNFENQYKLDDALTAYRAIGEIVGRRIEE